MCFSRACIRRGQKTCQADLFRAPCQRALRGRPAGQIERRPLGRGCRCDRERPLDVTARSSTRRCGHGWPRKGRALDDSVSPETAPTGKPAPPTDRTQARLGIGRPVERRRESRDEQIATPNARQPWDIRRLLLAEFRAIRVSAAFRQTPVINSLATIPQCRCRSPLPPTNAAASREAWRPTSMLPACAGHSPLEP